MFRTLRNALCAAALAAACMSPALAQSNNGTPSSPTNPTGVTAPSYAFYALSLYSPLLGASGGTGTATPYKKLTLAAGVGTWTFATPYTNVPVCVATEVGVAGRTLAFTAKSASALTVTSSVTSGNTDEADVICFAAPN